MKSRRDCDDRQPLTFGGVTLDRAECRLTRHGRPIDLTGKPFELLAMLVRRAPALVTREEIRATLWQDRVVEYDAAINACIRDIRKALGDDVRRPRFIETVPRHGYRMVAKVTSTGARSRQHCLYFSVVIFAVLFLTVIASRQTSGPGELESVVPPAKARQAFVKGEQLLATHDPRDARRAVTQFDQAVTIDPYYAEAWATLADAHYFAMERPGDAMPAAERAISRALELAPKLARVHRRLADLYFVWHWEYQRAEESYRRALDLDAGDSASHHAYAAFLIADGRGEEAIAHMQYALAIDPLSTVLRGDLAWFYAMVGRHEAALEECRLLVELLPDNRRAIGCSLRPLLALGRLEAAAGVVRQLMPDQDMGYLPAVRQIERYWHRRLEFHQAELAAGRFVDPVAMAVVHARLGDPVRTMRWIERALNERSRTTVYIRLLPEFQALHTDRRFIEASLPSGSRTRM